MKAIDKALASGPETGLEDKHHSARKAVISPSAKMEELLIVCGEVNQYDDTTKEGATLPNVITLSVDEKPGVQAIGIIAEDIAPDSGKNFRIR